MPVADVLGQRPKLPGVDRIQARWRPLLVTAVVAGLALRLAFSLGYWVGKPLTQDEQEYLHLARSLVEGRGLSYAPLEEPEHPGGHFERPPVYPLFVAGVLRLSGGTSVSSVSAGVPTPVKVAQSLLGAITVWLIGMIARRAAGPAAGLIAASVAAVYPPLVWISAYLLTEALYAVLAMAIVWILGEVTDRALVESRWPAFAAGLVAGVAVLAREATVLFLMIAGLWLLARRRLVVATLLLGGALVVLLPWMARNAAVYGQIVLGAPHGGVTFWTGNNPVARGEGDMAANPDIRKAQLAIEERYRGFGAQQLDSIYYREALSYVAAHPVGWIGLEVRKAFFTFVPIGPSYRLHSTRYFVASVVSYLAMLPFALAGVARLTRERHPPRALWLMAASAVFTSLVFFPQERFRIPIIDPTVIVCAAAWLAAFVRPIPAAERP